ncbi:protein PSY3 [Ricinus communis]|uniref:Uncharacterized protein n=1 Tax=Ricinus communis TaxID=3988 RepID=B9SI40_RICCO|nr:protein PSY3 [Ricinus communis]EEF36777.1 conserved hypothetical protein [Ricinus communis]|eukprot:XP_002525659.1 protein PSY3 [Ricinus communis]
MDKGVGLCFCLLLVFALLSSARNPIPISENGIALANTGRSLKAMLNDYSEPSANQGHDPRSKDGNNNGGGGGNSRGGGGGGGGHSRRGLPH